MKISYISNFSKSRESIFFAKITIFAAICFIILPLIVPYKDDIIRENVPGHEIYRAISKSLKITKGVKVLVLGDSIANQLYSVFTYNGEIYSLACNQAISLAGQYILLKNFIDSNNVKGLKVYLVYHPSSFSNNLDQKFSFDYFLKPFYKIENFSLYTVNLKHQIYKIPYYFTALLPITKITALTPKLNSNISKKIKKTVGNIYILEEDQLFSDISIDYLKKIKLLSEEEGFQVKVISPFLRSEFSEYDQKIYRKKIVDNRIQEIFKNYFEFKILDNANFKDDVHYSNAELYGKDPLGLLTPSLIGSKTYQK